MNASEARRKKWCSTYELMVRPGCGTWTDRAVMQCLRSLHMRGHACTLRSLTSPRGGRKGGARRGVTSPKSHTSHFASRLQEKQLQLEKKYDMEN